ncbi:glycosyltransferase [Vibrio coralliilyticus]|uniref:glycosyltransferase n=1 Tax=Vibrio coralliilyticus TaxID=190893 RepID=UPI00155FD7D6|nr:glycosyltransferase [Vibrio coralliilyticus]NRF31298.1 glycosyltransferase [Vibrio coralliilyticus]NRF54794.1 glycosyltransferase [Vibrio coralliilyticus]
MARVLVLLAAYNGEDWISDQIDSILRQKDVDVNILCSVDLSHDSTYELVNCYPSIEILPYGERFGGAGPNFYRLFRDANLANYDYIALSDQDDVWLEDKLITAILEMEKKMTNALSSNVTAFWKNGRQKEIVKANPQTSYDHFFESPGPGCSFVLDRKLALSLQMFIRSKKSSELIDLHDWLIYAYARCSGFRWAISSTSKLLYRQHESNQCGANSGFSGVFNRYKIMKTGWYSNQVLKLFEIFDPTNSICGRIKRKNALDSLILSAKCCQFRRKNSEKIMLFFVFILRLF